jgi:hypothetical protein
VRDTSRSDSTTATRHAGTIPCRRVR